MVGTAWQPAHILRIGDVLVSSARTCYLCREHAKRGGYVTVKLKTSQR
jgi:hypothetical protein